MLGSILLERPDARGIGVDIDPFVVLAAGANLERHGISGRAVLRSGDLLGPVDEVLDMVVSNPPYIADAEWDALDASVRGHEPRLALVGNYPENQGGLQAYRDLVPQALDKLKPGGWIVVEIGWQQAQGVQELLQDEQWTDVTTLQDLAGRDRVVCARRI